MLADIDLLTAPTAPTALLDCVPVGLDDDYLYSTLVRPRRRARHNTANVNQAYGPQSGAPTVRGSVIDAGA